VRHHHHRDALPVEILEERHDFHAGVRIERAGGLVGQYQDRIVDEGARDGHPLLLTAGELRGVMVLPLGEADRGQRRAPAAGRVIARRGSSLPERGCGSRLKSGTEADFVAHARGGRGPGGDVEAEGYCPRRGPSSRAGS
jgi:hypothetical protein